MGYFKHDCPDWDFMKIDEHCLEIMCCDCFNDSALEMIKEGYKIITYDYKNKGELNYD